MWDLHVADNAVVTPCLNMENLPRPLTTSNHKCLSRLPGSTVESDNNHMTANLAIKNWKPFTRARAREEAVKNCNKKSQQLIIKSQQGSITEREELFLKKLARKTTSEDKVLKAFLEIFPDRSKSFVQQHWVKVKPLPQQMTRSQTERQWAILSLDIGVTWDVQLLEVCEEYPTIPSSTSLLGIGVVIYGRD